MKKLTLPLLFAVMMMPQMALADVTLGVLANRGELKAKEEWSEFADQMSKDVGTPVKLVPLTIEKAATAFSAKEVDLLLANPVLLAGAQEFAKGKMLLSVNTDRGNQFGGVIIANKAAGIKTSADMKGKKVMSYGTDSAGAYIFQVYHLKQKGIDAKKDFAQFTAAKKQDDVVMAVKAGVFDAGFVRTGLLESLEKKNIAKVDDFVIVDKANDLFADVHSTALYPEWGIIAQGDMDAAITGKFKAAALALKPDASPIQKATIKGFAEPLSLAPLVTVLKELQSPPFDK